MHNIGAVILAAGESSRLGQPKQLLQFRGKSLLRRAVDGANEAGCSPIVVVLGSGTQTAVYAHRRGWLASESGKHDQMSGSMEGQLMGSPARIVKNQNWRAGIGTSIRAGVQSLIDNNDDVTAIIVLACDQPFVDVGMIKQLIRIRKKTNKPIVAASYSGTLGIPALFDRSCFKELLALRSDRGAKPLILRDQERVATFQFPAGSVDIDTPADYEKLNKGSFRPLSTENVRSAAR
jgi:molybdenum cofactor cytidylyltransferase